jgi:hypothetical protein
MAGLVPAIPIIRAEQCLPKRDARHKAGHDGAEDVAKIKPGMTVERLSQNTPASSFRDGPQDRTRNPESRHGLSWFWIPGSRFQRAPE